MSQRSTSAIILLLCVIALLTGVNTWLLASGWLRERAEQRQATQADVRARADAERIRSASRLRAIGQALVMYAYEHQGRVPAGDGGWLQPLYDNQYLSPDVFDPVIGSAGPMPYRYVAPASLTLYPTSPEAAETVLGFEDPKMWDGAGANVLFADTHVEWIESPRLRSVLAGLEGEGR